MQSIVLHAESIVQQALDAAGNAVLEIRSRLSFLPSIPVGDKIVREFADDEGKAVATSTGRTAATSESFILARLAGIALHRCRGRSCGFDGGGEGQGAQHQNGRAGTRSCLQNGHTSNKNGFGSYHNVVDV